MITNRICKACTMELCDRKLEADMFVLDTGGYDVILSMTSLSKYHAVIDCRNKKVIFRISHQLEFQFIGERKFLRKEDPRLLKFREQVEAGLRSDICIHTDGSLYFRGKIFVPQGEIRQKILAEAHSSACLLYTSPSPRDRQKSRMPSSA